MKSFNIVVCASGGGGNFRSLINHQSSYDYHISLLIVDRECKAINVANENNIPCIVLEKKFLGDSFFEEFTKSDSSRYQSDSPGWFLSYYSSMHL